MSACVLAMMNEGVVHSPRVSAAMYSGKRIAKSPLNVGNAMVKCAFSLTGNCFGCVTRPDGVRLMCLLVK